MKYSSEFKEEVRDLYQKCCLYFKDTSGRLSERVWNAVRDTLDKDVSKRTLRDWTSQYRTNGEIDYSKIDVEDIGDFQPESKSLEVEEKETNSGLTDELKHFIFLLPEEKEKIKSTLNMDDHMFKNALTQLSKEGVQVKYDEDANCYYLPDQPAKRRLSSKAKATITKEANEFRSEQEAAVLRRLRARDPIKTPIKAEDGNEDLVVAISDVHVGDVCENEHGNEIYNPKRSFASIQYLTKKAIEIKNKTESITEYDTCHLVWGGDMLTCEGIYDGQAFDIKLLLLDQLSLTVEMLTQQAISLSKQFDKLQIVAVPGNHGRVRSSSMSGQANMDLVAYRWVADRLHEHNIDNINLMIGEAKHYRNFKLRGGEWKMHLRHGHDEQVHVDATARSQADQRGLVEKHGADGFIRGHHHTHRREDILNHYPVITLPSPKPGGDFAEKIGRADCSDRRKLGAIWGCSDKRLITGYYVINDLDMDEHTAPSLQEIRERSI